MQYLNEPVIVSPEVKEYAESEALSEELSAAEESSETVTDPLVEDTVSSGNAAVSEGNTVVPEDILTNEVYMDGVNQLISTIDNETVHEEVAYVDRGTFYNLGSDLPDYVVIYECNGVEVVFPTDYAEDILVSDGMLVNLGSNYTAGLQIEGYTVDNYLSSEITIPTYHSATWYQYLQTYGQPYRIVDRYVNYNGYISSSTREIVSVEWSGGNPWEGFTFDRIVLFMLVLLLVIMFVFRKGK